MRRDDQPVRVRLCADGPMLLRGVEQLDVDGETYDVVRPVVAICRCGASALFPYCDSTHKQLNRRGTT